MARQRAAKRGKTVEIEVAAGLLDVEEGERAPESAAYAFSAGGRLLAQAKLDKSGQARLSVPTGDEGTSVRIVVGPQVERDEPRVSELLRRGAQERFLQIQPGMARPKLELEIPRDFWICWFLRRCTVRGTLLKRTESAGIPVDLPVCNARVEIYEVDPIHVLIPRLPDAILERIRDLIVRPRPIPEPDPPPFRVFPPRGPEDIVSKAAVDFGNGPIFEADPEILAEGEWLKAMLAGPPTDDSDPQLLKDAPRLQLRQLLIDRPHLIRPLLCRFFPQFVRTTLIATATTDDCGRFTATFFRSCSNPDTPDLYFKAFQRFFFFEIPVYAPTPIACHTYWNYQCGTEVTLYTTHPWAQTCSPCRPIDAPPNWVLVMAIGNHPLSLIRGTAAALQATTNPTNIGLTGDDAPWGGLLRFRVEFDNSLREDLGVRYYRMSWRKGTTGAFTPMNLECHRHYTQEIAGDLVLKAFPLGPNVVGGEANLFEIPPSIPPGGGQWSFPDLREDLTSGKFVTTDVGPAATSHGKYQIQLELFTAAGAPVNIGALGITYRVPTSTNLSGDIDTEDAAPLGLVVGNTFVMTVHIDNNPCTASTDAPLLDGVAANACGVMEYSSGPSGPLGTVTMNYTASHPNGFATYGFTVVRGVTVLTPPTTSGDASTGAPFTATASVADLLQACPIAGFAETLSVWAMATDGWDTLTHLNAHAIPRAFVLAPQGAGGRGR